MVRLRPLGKDRPSQLLAQRRLGKIINAVADRVGAGDLGGAERHVPEKQQIAVIALVLHRRIMRVAAMMGMVGGRGRDRPFNYPQQGR